MNNFIDRDTYKNMPVKSKLDVLYDMQLQTHERLDKLEYKKIWNTCLSAVSGVVGGFLAIIGREIWKR